MNTSEENAVSQLIFALVSGLVAFCVQWNSVQLWYGAFDIYILSHALNVSFQPLCCEGGTKAGHKAQCTFIELS